MAIFDKLFKRTKDETVSDEKSDPIIVYETEVKTVAATSKPSSAILEVGEVTPLSFEEQSKLMTKEKDLARVMQAAVHQAVVVMGEATSVPGHDLRANFAQRVIHNGDNHLARIIFSVVLTNPNCGTDVSDPLIDDSALLYVIAEKWNALSGYSAYIVVG